MAYIVFILFKKHVDLVESYTSETYLDNKLCEWVRYGFKQLLLLRLFIHVEVACHGVGQLTQEATVLPRPD